MASQSGNQTKTAAADNESDDASSSSQESTEFNRSAVSAIQLRLVTHANDDASSSVQFSPLFAHQLFPDARVVGYKEPAIAIAIAHDSLFAHASVAFADRAAEPPHTNIARRLRDYSPKSAPIEFDRAAFVARAFTPAHGGQAAAFVPPGTRLLSYRLGDSDEFEVYSGLLDDAAMRAYVERASLLLPFFIERASYVKPEANWLALLLFQRRSPDTVSFVGLLTLYRWPVPLAAPRERWRISQVLVLPPFQRRGHGACLLRAAYHAAGTWAAAPVDDITVEEPSCEFTQMRDAVDLEMLVEAGVLPMREEPLVAQPTRWRVPGEPRTLVDSGAVGATCRAARERFRLCEVQTRRLIRAARYLNGDANRAPESGGEPDVANPRTLSLRERWCAARHWRVYGEPLARMQRMQAGASILRAHESEAAAGVERVIGEWSEEAEAFEKLRETFKRAMKQKQ